MPLEQVSNSFNLPITHTINNGAGTANFNPNLMIASTFTVKLRLIGPQKLTELEVIGQKRLL